MHQRAINLLLAGVSKSESALLEETLMGSELNIGVQTKVHPSEFSTFLNSREWDLVIADLDGFNSGIEKALLETSVHSSHLPVLLVGSPEQEAVGLSAMNAGAADFIPKDNMKRLIPAINRELVNANIRKWHDKTEAQNKLLAHILEKSHNEVYLLDSNTLKFVYANNAILSNLGYTEHEILQMVSSEIADPHYREAAMEIIKPFLKGDQDKITFELNRMRKDGSIYPAMVQLEKIRQQDKEYILGISFDTTQQKQDAIFHKQQEKEKSRLKLENKYKSDFIANLSHEMRTTINSVLLLSKILAENREENLKKEQVEYLDAIHNANNSLLELLNEVLDLSKIEAGKIDIKLETLDLKKLCEYLEQLFKPIAREAELFFECTMDDNLPQNIITDRLRLEQILNNLISNALKFTKTGGIQLHLYKPGVKELQDEQISSRKMVAISVIDTGIGIPFDKQELVFEDYSQAEGIATLERFGGTGLGLAISNDISRILGGKLTLESTPNKGTTFTVYLPKDSTSHLEVLDKKGKVRLAKKEEKEELTIPKQGKQKKTSRGTVLLVDDSNLHNMALKEFLSFKINHCITAESAGEAYDCLTKEEVNCIVLDMYLPDANGREVLQRLKEDPKTADIPVIVYSGKNLNSEEEEYLNQYALNVVQKNVMSYKVLMDQIVDIIESQS